MRELSDKEVYSVSGGTGTAVVLPTAAATVASAEKKLMKKQRRL